MSDYLLSVRHPQWVRSLAVENSFELSPRPGACAWVPADVLVDTALENSRADILIEEDAEGEPTLIVNGERVGSEWRSGELALSVSHMPTEFNEVGTGVLKGTSLALRRLLRDIRLAAKSDASVLIQGETGTGKELIARTVHDLSGRSGKPYAVIDCTAISETLFESELFGHAKGSFSGANANRVGPFEEADGGTVLIDEIGEIPLALQPKLLRVLESGTVRRVGENTHRPVNVRVIGATHRDLHKMVQDGQFRGDLYYRLAVLELRSPPLRDRHGDLSELLHRYVPDALFDELNEEQWEAIETHPWLGNIRELRNFAQRAETHGWNTLFNREDYDVPVAKGASSPQKRRASQPPPGPRATGTAASTSDAPPVSDIAEAARAAEQQAKPIVPRANDPRDGETLADFRARWNHDGEALYLKMILKRAGGSITKAARMAEIDRTHLHRILRKHGLSKSGERESVE